MSPSESHKIEDADAPIVAEARAGGRRAFEKLLLKYDRLLWSMARGFCDNNEDASDVVQEAFLRAYRGLSGFRGRSKFKTWLIQILLNLCRSYRRKKAILRGFGFLRAELEEQEISQIPDSHPGAHPEAHLERRRRGMLLKRALLSLPRKQREVFALKYIHQMKIREIAEALGLAEGTVKAHLFHATENLRRELHDKL